VFARDAFVKSGEPLMTVQQRKFPVPLNRPKSRRYTRTDRRPSNVWKPNGGETRSSLVWTTAAHTKSVTACSSPLWCIIGPYFFEEDGSTAWVNRSSLHSNDEQLHEIRITQTYPSHGSNVNESSSPDVLRTPDFILWGYIMTVKATGFDGV